MCKNLWTVSGNGSSVKVYGTGLEVSAFCNLLALITGAKGAYYGHRMETTYGYGALSLEEYFKTIPPIGKVSPTVTHPDGQETTDYTIFIPRQSIEEHYIHESYLSNIYVCNEVLLSGWGNMVVLTSPYRYNTSNPFSSRYQGRSRDYAEQSMRQDLDNLSAVHRFNSLMKPFEGMPTPIVETFF